MAGEFNPDARLPFAQNYLGYSKGYRDNSLGDFASGIAKDLDTGLGALDRGVAQKASDDVRSAVEDTDASILGIQNQTPSVDPLDKEVRGQVRNLENKKLAMDAGTIDPQHYYATVQAKVKDIRARYAGYNETIDSELQKMGIDPNWQRKQIIEEGMKAQAARAGAAQEAAKNNREFAEQAFSNPKNIFSPDMRAEWASDPSWAQNPSNMKRLKLELGKSNIIYSNAELAKLEADTDTTVNGNQANKTAQSYDKSLNTLFYAAAKNGGVYDLLNKALANVQQDQTMNGGVVSPEHDQALRVAYSRFRTVMEQGRAQVASQYSDSPWNWSDQRKKVDEAFSQRLDDIDKSINNKDWGAIQWNVANNEAMVTNAQAGQLGSSDFMKKYAALRKNAGDAGAAVIMSESADVKDAFTKDLMNGLHSDQVSGNIKSLNDMMTRCRDASVSDPKCYKSMFDSTLNLIQSKDTKTVGRLSSFETMFSKENQGWWDNVMSNDHLSDADKRAYYRTLTSPRMQESVKELGTIDRQANTKYYQYVNYMFSKLNEDSVKDIQDVVSSSNTQQVTYDPNTYHLQINNVTNPDSTILGSFWDNFRGGESAVENWNQGIDALIPLWKENGIDPEQATQTMMQRAGIDLNANRTGNTLDNLYNNNAKGTSNENPINVQQIDEKGNYVGPAKLGGPGSTPVESSPTSIENTDARTGTLKEIGEVQKMLADETLDPSTRADLQAHMKDLVSTLRTPFQPRGAPATGTPTDEQQSNAKEWIDNLTGIPSFMDAVKNGDVAGAALAAATILPFPGGKAAKLGEKAVEGGAKVIDNVTREARGAAKGLEAQAAREASAIQELKSIDVSKLSDEGLSNVENQLRMGLASKNLSNDQISAIFDKIKEVSIELGRRTPLTPAEQVMRDSNLKTLQSLERDKKLAKNKGLEVIDGGKTE